MEDKRIVSFGSMQLRINNCFSNKKTLKLPGPGAYNVQSAHYHLNKKNNPNKQKSFGTTL